MVCLCLSLLICSSTLAAQPKDRSKAIQLSKIEWKWENSGREFPRLIFIAKNTTKKRMENVHYKVVCLNEAGKVLYSAVHQSAINADLPGMTETEQTVYLPWSEGEDIRRDSKQVIVEVE